MPSIMIVLKALPGIGLFILTIWLFVLYGRPKLASCLQRRKYQPVGREDLEGDEL